MHNHVQNGFCKRMWETFYRLAAISASSQQCNSSNGAVYIVEEPGCGRLLNKRPLTTVRILMRPYATVTVATCLFPYLLDELSCEY